MRLGKKTIFIYGDSMRDWIGMSAEANGNMPEYIVMPLHF